MKPKSPAPLLFLCLVFCTFHAAAQTPDTNTSELKEITGRVVSDSGQPLAGAIIAAGRSGGAIGQRTSSDNEGNFRIQGLDPGFYRVFASLPGYVSQVSAVDFNNPTSYFRPGDSVSLTLIKGGVISGVITNITGEPLVNVTVRAFRIRTADGEKIPGNSVSQPRMTDDRGYYRLYGLQAGTYIVSAGGQGQYFGGVNPFANDAPTYAPASTRDTAAEFVVRPDQDVTADIRYRGEPGHAVSGKIIGGPTGTNSLPVNAGVRLIDLDSQTPVTAASATGEERTFQLNGVSDGEYEIAAFASVGGPAADLSASAPRRISVKGADVTGIELSLAPMAQIAGRVNLELDEKLKCGRRRDNALRETMIVVRRERPEEKSSAKSSETTDSPSAIIQGSLDTIPNDKGEIVFRNLSPANYRFEVRLPGAGWYLKDLALSSDSKGPANKMAPNLPKNGLAIKAGDRISGLTVTIVEGGAGLRGRISTSDPQNLTAGLRVYLVPAERDSSENILRFFEATAEADGKFAIGNIAPGKYWLIAQPQDASPKTRSIRTDSALRARVLREAESSKREVVFKPCERNLDYELPAGPRPANE